MRSGCATLSEVTPHIAMVAPRIASDVDPDEVRQAIDPLWPGESSMILLPPDDLTVPRFPEIGSLAVPLTEILRLPKSGNAALPDEEIPQEFLHLIGGSNFLAPAEKNPRVRDLSMGGGEEIHTEVLKQNETWVDPTK